MAGDAPPRKPEPTSADGGSTNHGRNSLSFGGTPATQSVPPGPPPPSPAPPPPPPASDDDDRQTSVLADHPISSERDDRLGFRVYADSLANLLDDPRTDTPLTVAISAPWGAGKTSLARMVELRLADWPTERGDPPHVTCWFNAWMNSDAPHLGVAFAAEVARTANRHRRLWRRILSPLPSSMLTPGERHRRQILLAAVALGATLLVWWNPGWLGIDVLGLLPPPVEGNEEVAAAGMVIALSTIMALWSRLFASGKNLAAFLEDPQSEAAHGSVREASRQLAKLSAEASRGKRRLVVFVDDLERCDPAHALQVCEVANQLLAHPSLITVLVTDLSIVATAAQAKHGPDGSGNAVGSMYLQKIVQVEFDLPIAGRSALVEMLKAPAAQARPHQPSPGVEAVVHAARHEARLAWVMKLRRYSGRAAVLILALGTVIYGVLEETGRAGTELSLLAEVLLLISLVALWAAVVLYVVARIAGLAIALSRRRMTRSMDQEFSATPGAAQDVLETSPSAKPADDSTALRLQRARRSLVEQMVRSYAGHSPLTQFLPPIPRSAKRAWYHLHILVGVAIGRGLFHDEATTASRFRSLEKWVVLRQRWPELSWAIIRHPEWMELLEAETDRTGLETLLRTLGLHTQVEDELVSFLQHDPPIAKTVSLFTSGPGQSLSGSARR